MPRGEHFKKPNPRNYQVSFKVNKTELELLNRLVKDSGKSLAEWFRGKIYESLANPEPDNDDKPVTQSSIPDAPEDKPARKKAKAEKKSEEPAKEEKQESPAQEKIKKERKDPDPRQTSLFD